MVASEVRAKLQASQSIAFVLRLALVVSLVVLGLFSRLGANEHLVSTRKVEDIVSLPSPSMLKVVSLGHREWVTSLLWVRALVYFGETMSQRLPQRYLQQYADTMEEVDPAFRRVYLWAAVVSMYNTKSIRTGSVEAAIRHLERGLKAFPDDPELTHLLGYHYFFELPSTLSDPNAQRSFRLRGAGYLRRGAALGYGPPWMALAAVGAFTRLGMEDQVLAEVEALYERTSDPELRRRLQARLEELRQHRQGDPSLAEFERVDQERRGSFPYLSTLQYLFVGPQETGILRARPPRELEVLEAGARLVRTPRSVQATGQH